MKFLLSAFQCLLLSSDTGAGAAVAPAAVNARVPIQQVERSFVGSGTTVSYSDQLVRFILHLYDRKKEYLVDSHRTHMDMYNNTDARNFQRRRTRW